MVRDRPGLPRDEVDALDAHNYFKKSILTKKQTNMSKDKGGKNIKKAPAAAGKKMVSDYQAGKQTVSRDEIAISRKK